MRFQKGFSLVELLVVVIIIAVIAAIAIPSLLASRRAANEASAINSLRAIHSAQRTYFSVFGQNLNHARLSDLGSADLIDPLLGGADTTTKSGYSFTISRPVSAPFSVYCATGVPTTFGATGSRDFLVSVDGVIYASLTDGSMSCSDGLPDTSTGSAIQ